MVVTMIESAFGAVQQSCQENNNPNAQDIHLQVEEVRPSVSQIVRHVS